MVDFSLQTGFDNRPPYCMIAHTTVCSNFFSNGCSLSPSWNKLYSEILRGHPWFIFRNKSTNIIIVLLLVNYTCLVHISTKNKQTSARTFTPPRLKNSTCKKGKLLIPNSWKNIHILSLHFFYIMNKKKLGHCSCKYVHVQ